jgi:anti-sigma B factor antagonist/stage II sporulation protein AA (anti-sigma F factor antagonist)
VEIASRVHGDVLVVAPSGRLDHAVAADFERTLLPLLDPAAGSKAGVIIDLTRVDYISSVGLRVLMIAGKSMRARRSRIAVAGLQKVVAEIFAISRFDGVVEVYPSVDAALAAISPDAQRAFEASQRRPER